MQPGLSTGMNGPISVSAWLSWLMGAWTPQWCYKWLVFSILLVWFLPRIVVRMNPMKVGVIVPGVASRLPYDVLAGDRVGWCEWNSDCSTSFTYDDELGIQKVNLLRFTGNWTIRRFSRSSFNATNHLVLACNLALTLYRQPPTRFQCSLKVPGILIAWFAACHWTQRDVGFGFMSVSLMHDFSLPWTCWPFVIPTINHSLLLSTSPIINYNQPLSLSTKYIQYFSLPSLRMRNYQPLSPLIMINH